MALAMVGEALISASVEILLNRITSSEFRDFSANKKLNVSLLDELKRKLMALNVVLNDAEEKQITDSAVKAWLDELKDAVFDAEDLLDEINTESLRCKVEGDSKTFTTQVTSFLSSPFNQFYRSMNSRLEAISRKLGDFLKQKDILALKSVSRNVSYRTVADSLVEPDDVVARENDKEKLLSMLLSDEDKNNNIEVLTIWGMGGLGKTTLAKCLYNESAVKKHFDLTTWAWLSDDFDAFSVTKIIVESVTSKKYKGTNFDALRVDLKNSLKDKRILLVLDDLWNDEYNDWHHLIAPLRSVKKRSKIIVTTRQHRVAQVTHTFPIYELTRLTDENCLYILAKHAFGSKGCDKFLKLEEIGRKIAEKCNGLPLAAKTLGGLLRSNVDTDHWNEILKSNLWAHQKEGIDSVMDGGRLPSTNAQRESNGVKRLVSGKSTSYYEGGEIQATVRNLAFPPRYYDISKGFEGLYERKLLRSFLPLSKYGSYGLYVTKKVSHDWLPKLRYLRTLSLSYYQNITELPDSISNLVLLRYLDLSYTHVKRLPDAACILYNLQTLKLAECKVLSQLPEEIGNLVNLRHLDIRGTYLLTMPAQICKLQNLRLLNSFVVGKEDGVTIQELRNFPHLQGMLSILKLQNVVDPKDAFQADLKKKENLEELMLEWGIDPQNSQIERDVLENLQPSTKLKKLSITYYNGTSFPKWLGDSLYSNVIFLCLSDCNYCTSLPPFGQLPYLKTLVITRMEMVKTIGDEFYCNNGSSIPFQPFPSLESIKFREMSQWDEWLPFEGEGSKFPFPSLKHLSLSKCPKLRGNLPKHLPSLTDVSISECNKLEAKSCDVHWNTSIESIDIQRGEGLLCLLDIFSYKKLSIGNCDSFSSFPGMILASNCLQILTLSNIPNLISFPADGLPTSLQTLDIERCRKLEFLSLESWHKYTSLRSLTISRSCDSLVSLAIDYFPALESLNIWYCHNLEAITTQGGITALKLDSLQVWHCRKLRSLSGQIDLPALRWLYLKELPELTQLSPSYLPSSLQHLDIEVGMLSSMSKDELGFLFQHLTSLYHLHIRGRPGKEEFIKIMFKELLLPISLQYLYIWDLYGLKCLEGKGLQHLTSLQSLYIENVDDLKLLEGNGFQHLTSLKRLCICYCKSLESLPEDHLPPSLELLKIKKCPLLEVRYQSRKGKYWSKIAHIPAIHINDEVII